MPDKVKGREVVPTTIEQLKKIGFVEAPSEVKDKKAIISIASIDKEGKTDLALSGPPPVMYIDIDVGGTGVVEKFKASGKEVYIYKMRFSKDMDQTLAVTQWDELRDVLISAWGLPSGTVAIDTFTEAYDLCRLARLGKLEQVPPLKYVEVNKEIRELVRLAYESKMNTVFVHKMKAEWIGGQKTANFELMGWGDIEYNTQLNLRPFTVVEKPDGKDGDPVVHFWVTVRNSRMNAKMTGKKYECGKAGDLPGNMLEKLIEEMYKQPRPKLLKDDDEKPAKKRTKLLKDDD